MPYDRALDHRFVGVPLRPSPLLLVRVLGEHLVEPGAVGLGRRRGRHAPIGAQDRGHPVRLRLEFGVAHVVQLVHDRQGPRAPGERRIYPIHPASRLTHLAPPLVMFTVRATCRSSSSNRVRSSVCSQALVKASSARNATLPAALLRRPVATAANTAAACRWASAGVRSSISSALSRNRKRWNFAALRKPPLLRAASRASS